MHYLIFKFVKVFKPLNIPLKIYLKFDKYSDIKLLQFEKILFIFVLIGIFKLDISNNFNLFKFWNIVPIFTIEFSALKSFKYKLSKLSLLMNKLDISLLLKIYVFDNLNICNLLNPSNNLLDNEILTKLKLDKSKEVSALHFSNIESILIIFEELMFNKFNIFKLAQL